MNYVSNLFFLIILGLGSSFIFSMEEYKSENQREEYDLGKLNILPDDMKKEILKYILFDPSLKNKSLKELERILSSLMLTSKGLRYIINANKYSSKIMNIMNYKKEQLGFRLINAVRAGSLEKVKKNIELGASPNAGYDVNINITALMYASMLGYLGIGNLLIQSGAKIDLKNGDSKTALMFAVNWKKLNMVQLLIGLGADIDITDRDGKSALDLARDANIKDFIQEAKNKIKKRKIQDQYLEMNKKLKEDILFMKN